MVLSDSEKCERFRVYVGSFVLGLLGMFIVGPLSSLVISDALSVFERRIYLLLPYGSMLDSPMRALPFGIVFLIITGVPLFFFLFLWSTPRKLLKRSKMFLLYAWLAYSSSVLVFCGVSFILASSFSFSF